RYSEATLIKELESKGIGRPSTYSAIVNTIIERKYVKIQEKRIFPTDLGLTVNNFLTINFDSLFNVTFTAQMEDRLDRIEEGNSDWVNLLKEYYETIKNLIEKIDMKKEKKELTETTGIKCDKCGKEMIVKWSKTGKFLACSGYPECTNTKEISHDEEGEIVAKEAEALEEKCPKCQSNLIIKNGRFGKFIACSNYPKCKFTKPFTLGIKCPECGKGEFVEKRSKKGRVFYGCSNYPECKFITNFRPVDLSCPNCNNYYVEEHFQKDKTTFLKCPKCGTILNK
ncbi:MAG: topoisomerase DNA-binding C4 zinc finger domain-containing protein, partial [Candidatus Cloacimonetes bacterium]|nr:topoisomerase DNA-binding C4 zinc finger domain-containing protein [Candidatus Cloacimonadota bacterium]